ncbi:MAG: metallophosphatase family protein [Gemmatimonadetes bacterium]|nr:metallophosphatase family protein [Gemmatimonadota bacterium]
MGAGREGARYGLVADVHSNLQALETALAWIDGQSADAVYCLGDVVGYGGDPGACVELVRSRCAGTVRGNHDAAVVEPALRHWFNPHARQAIERQAELLDEAAREWLGGLPATLELDEIALTHSGFADPGAFDYVTGPYEAEREIRAMDVRWGFFAHTHVPAGYRLRTDGAVEAFRLTEDARGDRLGGEGVYLVNPGAVGQPRDGDPRAACGIFDRRTSTFHWTRLEYDLEAAQAAIRRSGMPEFEAERLARGR